MANTDDIAEKLAGLLLDQTAKAANFTYDSGKALVKGVGTLTTKGLDKLMKDVKKAEELRKVEGLTGEVSLPQLKEFSERLAMETKCTRVAASDVEEFEALLRANKILYARADDGKDDAKIFFVLNRDEMRLKDVAEAFNAQRGQMTYIKPELYFRDVAPKDVRIVQGLDSVEHELFQHYAREAGLLFTSVKRQDKYILAFAASDAEKAKRAMLHVSWDLTGQGGARVREQVEYRLKGRSAVQISAMEGKRELYIASQRNPGHYVHITSTDCAMYKGSERVGAVSRADNDFYVKATNMVRGLEDAILFEPGTFHPELTPEEVSHYHTMNLHPQGYDELVEQARQNELINLISKKSAIDDEHNNTWGISDPSVSYSEFSGEEFFMDVEEQEAQEREFEHFKEAAFYGEERFITDDIELDERNLDVIIARAEAKREAYGKSDPQRDNEKEQAQDPSRS